MVHADRVKRKTNLIYVAIPIFYSQKEIIVVNLLQIYKNRVLRKVLEKYKYLFEKKIHENGSYDLVFLYRLHVIY